MTNTSDKVAANNLNYLLLLLGSASLSTLLILLNVQYVASDDALFYLQIARSHFVDGLPSFNGVIPTNGFHPLQGLLLIIVHTLFSAPGAFLPAALVIGATINTLTLVILFRLLKVISNENHALVFALISALALYLLGGMYFSEAALNAHFLTLTILLLLRVEQECSTKKVLLLGVVTGFATLARLDNVFILPIALVLLLKSRRISIFQALACAGAFTIVITPYLTWNKLYFGSIMPVSGWVKSTFPLIRGFSDAWADTTLLSRIVFVALIAALALLLARPKRFAAVHAILLCAIFNWLYYFLFQRAAYHSWYFIAAVIAILVAIAEVCGNFERKILRRGLIGCGLSFLIALPLYTTAKGYSKGFFNINEFILGRTWGKVVYYDVAASANAALPDGERVLAFDIPGYLGFFGNLSVFPIDCLNLSKSSCQELYSDPNQFLSTYDIHKVIWAFPNGCNGSLPLVEYYSKKPIGTLAVDCSKAQLLSEDFAIYVVPVKVEPKTSARTNKSFYVE